MKTKVFSIIVMMMILAVPVLAMTKTYDANTRTVLLKTGAVNVSEIQLVSIRNYTMEFEANYRIRTYLNVTVDPDNYRFTKILQEGNDVDAIETFRLDQNGAWIPFNFDNNFELKSHKDYFIKVIATRRMKVGYQSADILPIMGGLSLEEFTWWTTNASTRTNVTIENIAGKTLSNFPFPIKLDTTTSNTSMISCTDPQVANSSDNRILAFHMENNTCSLTNKNVNWLWAKDSLLTNSNQTYGIYYNFNTTPYDASNFYGVFDNDYVYVFHNDYNTSLAVNYRPNLNGTALQSMLWQTTGIFGTSMKGLGNETATGAAGIIIANGWSNTYFNDQNTTIEIWFNTTSDLQQAVFGKTTGSELGININQPGTGDIRFYATGASSFDNIGSPPSTKMEKNKVHYLVGVLNKSTSLAMLYLDGVNIQNISAAGATDLTTAALSIGSGGSGGLVSFIGTMDEIRISNVTRSPEYIKEVWRTRAGTTGASEGNMSYLSLTTSFPTNSTLNIGSTLRANNTVVFNNSVSCQEELDGSTRALTIPNSGIPKITTWTSLVNGSHKYNVTCTEGTNTKTSEIYFTSECQYHFNLSFDKASGNMSLEMENGIGLFYSNTTREIYECSDGFPHGKIALNFNGNKQVIQFYNNGSEFQRNITIADGLWRNESYSNQFNISSNGIAILVTVSGIGFLENAVVESYITRGDGKKYLVGSGVTQSNGEANVLTLMVFGNEFLVTHKEYTTLSVVKNIVATSQRQDFKLEKPFYGIIGVTIYTNCPLVVQQVKTLCSITINATGVMDTTNITYNKNGVVYSYVDVNVTEFTKWITIQQGDGYNMSFYINGHLWGTLRIGWENYSARPVQIDVDFTGTKKGDRIILLMIMMIVSACVALIANRIATGSGLYAYGATIGLMGTMTGIWGAGLGGIMTAGTVLGIMLVVNIARKVVKG